MSAAAAVASAWAFVASHSPVVLRTRRQDWAKGQSDFDLGRDYQRGVARAETETPTRAAILAELEAMRAEMTVVRERLAEVEETDR